MKSHRSPHRGPGHEFLLAKRLDETLLADLKASADMPRGHICDLIKEHLIRRGKNCAICGKHHNRRDLVIDHRVPTSHGGQDNIENLQLLCIGCSLIKGNDTMMEVRKKLRAKKLQAPPPRNRRR